MNDNVTCGVVAPTYSDLRRVVFTGDSGIMNVINRDLLDESGYNKSNNEINFFNGSKVMGFPAQEPDRLRGVQFHRVWCDELASWRYPESFDNLMMALRLGQEPKCIITTTPRPTKIIKTLAKRKDTKVIRGTTFENMDNLASSSIEMLKERYMGTRLGRQELYAEILEDIEGALFNIDLIEKSRVEETPDLERIVVAIDPAVTNNPHSDETGIVVAGRDSKGHFYILNDSSMINNPDVWINKAISLYHQYDCDRIVAEVNNGGDLIERLLRTKEQNISYKSVRATRGKVIRAEPISALYEQNKVHHVGILKDLEEQMCQFTGNNVKSQHDDRVDALVWAITSLQSSGQAIFRIS
tara:strand:- start:766 stop:1830 length:1065 start_codon:yes stop_codon:yes gene_type:complete